MANSFDADRMLRITLGPVLGALALALLLAVAVDGASALTTEEVLKLRAAGVSDETIQKMIEAQSANPAGVPQNMVDQEYAARHIGTWNLPDGNVVLSTGKSREPGFDPTLPQSGNEYPMNVFPYVFPGGPGMGAPGPAPGPVLAPR